MTAMLIEQPVPAPPSVVEALSLWVREQSTTFKGTEKITLSTIMRKADELGKSGQGFAPGIREKPYNFSALKSLRKFSEHHATCCETKVATIFGLGHVMDDDSELGKKKIGLSIFDRLNSDADNVLDPLCMFSWTDLLLSCGHDYIDTGNAFMEVRRNGGTITGLHYAPVQDVDIVIEEQNHQYHYEINCSEGYSATTKFARFGELERLRGVLGNKDVTSELIHLRNPTNVDRIWGGVDWIAAVPSIELTKALHQFKHDFFLNRGVPEFMLFILGAKLEPADWKKVEDSIRANIGLGNSHKTIALNLEKEGIVVQLEKLAMDNPGEDTYSATKETLALSTVTAHRVPPLLAGIQIPGKLGSNNELPNALRAFQVLYAAPQQRIIYQILAKTLGNVALNGGLALDGESFKMHTILDEINIIEADTSARMKQTEADANVQGRKISDGLKT